MRGQLIKSFAARGALALVIIGWALAVCAAGTGPVGRFSVSRNAQVKIGDKPFSAAFVNQQVGNGDVVRTGRRSVAEITFKDSSVIRINERTDMVIQDAGALRKVRLDQGALWIKDVNGSHTRVQTPVGTATARGTIFVITSAGEVSVVEGFVDLEYGGEVLTLGPGESGGIGPNGKPIKLPFQLANLSIGPEGETMGWWVFDSEMPHHFALSGDDLLAFSTAGAPVSALVLSGGRENTDINPVPEPSTFLIGMVGVAGLYVLRHRR